MLAICFILGPVALPLHEILHALTRSNVKAGALISVLSRRKETTMADGNFNRTHLPARPYQSGLNAGRAQMHTRALQAFAQWAAEQGLSDEEQARALARFRALLPL